MTVVVPDLQVGPETYRTVVQRQIRKTERRTWRSVSEVSGSCESKIQTGAVRKQNIRLTQRERLAPAEAPPHVTRRPRPHSGDSHRKHNTRPHRPAPYRTQHAIRSWAELTQPVHTLRHGRLNIVSNRRKDTTRCGSRTSELWLAATAQSNCTERHYHEWTSCVGPCVSRYSVSRSSYSRYSPPRRTRRPHDRF